MKIHILDGYTINPGDLSWSPLEAHGRLTVDDRMKPIDVVEKAGDAEIILTSKIPLGRDILDMLTRLRYVGVLATGYNNVDIAYARQLGIPVTNIPGYSTDSVAQTVFAYILHLVHNVADYNSSVKAGDWHRSPDFSYLRTIPYDLTGRTLGVIGYGSIGKAVARIAKAFGMNCVCAKKSDGSLPSSLASDPDPIPAMSQDELAAVSDVISVHVPLTEATSQMINANFIGKLKKGVILINTARGGVISEADVLAGLESGRIGYYAADVYSQEPPPENAPLMAHPNALFTPHIAWASIESRQRVIDIAAANVGSWLSGDPVNLVN